jgi:hypothetical protein
MKIIYSIRTEETDLPLKLIISFKAVFDYLEKIEQDEDHYLYTTACNLLEEYKKFPILRDGFEDFKNLEKYNKQIDTLLDFFFAPPLEDSEITSASIPVDFTAFKLSKKFQEILAEAGDDYKLKLRNYFESNVFISSCLFILEFYHGVEIDFSRPYYMDIPNVKTGITRNYRVTYNTDFLEVNPLERAPNISGDDVKFLLDNFDDISVWKDKFPRDSYELKGFGIMELFDVTTDHLLSDLRENLMAKDENAFQKIEQNISKLFGSTSLKFEFSTFHTENNKVVYKFFYAQNSFLVEGRNDFNFIGDPSSSTNGHEDQILENVFKKREMLTISNVKKYGKSTEFQGFYKSLKKKGIQSVILVPISLTDELFGVMELSSKNKYELNSVNADKLKDVIPVFKMGALRYLEEYVNQLESIIQEHYTSLHPSVKWKFYNVAEEYLAKREVNNNVKKDLQNIIFEDVIPLFGQCDIRGSSLARNIAVQKDLIRQLDHASEIIQKAKINFKLPIYDDLLFRITDYKNKIKHGLNSGDEAALSQFLQEDIDPIFNHLRSLGSELKSEVEEYMKDIDQKLHVVYDKRKKYEQSVNTLNEELSKFIDHKQIEAQKMFPHYFECFKTDGIDYNMYIGQSIVSNKAYHKIYLHNLRLWQLEMMCELEIIAHNLKDKLEHTLEVASLILVHSTPLAIKFRMDEKRFDVDGARNVRYEVIKKRIEKAMLKNSNERLTQPGKIAIVYNQPKEAEEYFKYIKHLQSKKYLLDEIENLDVEDLKGISGLKTLRVTINYKQFQRSE